MLLSTDDFSMACVLYGCVVLLGLRLGLRVLYIFLLSEVFDSSGEGSGFFKRKAGRIQFAAVVKLLCVRRDEPSAYCTKSFAVSLTDFSTK